MSSNNSIWREDLIHSRDLNSREIEAFGFFIAWFDEWRIHRSLPLEVNTSRRFWKECVLAKPRKDWQLDQWAGAMRWLLNWVELCKKEKKDYRCIAERMKDAVFKTGRRRGLAENTLRTYAGWMVRYGIWVKDARSAMDHARAREWLSHLVTETKISYSTQKLPLKLCK